jgi:cell division transport system permease protein
VTDAVETPAPPPRRGALAPRSAAPYLVAVVSGAMCFLAVLALEAGAAAGRIAGAWTAGFEGVATVRVPAPEGRAAAERLALSAVAAVAAAPGVAEARVISTEETAALAAPWLGAGVDLATLPAPILIDLRLGPGFDAPAIQARLDEAAPGARLDDHAAWRAPLERAGAAFRRLAHWSVALMVAALVAMVAAAARASLAGAASTVRTLRLIGARDGFVASVFDRPIALRALAGGAIGGPAGVAAVLALPALGVAEALGAASAAADPALWPALAAPLASAVVAWVTARLAVLAILRRIEG